MQQLKQAIVRVLNSSRTVSSCITNKFLRTRRTVSSCTTNKLLRTRRRNQCQGVLVFLVLVCMYYMSVTILYSTETNIVVKTIFTGINYFGYSNILLPASMMCDGCNNFSQKYIFENQNICVNHDMLLVVMVTSAPHHSNRRQAIRQTWGGIKTHNGFRVQVLFVVGLTTDDTGNIKIPSPELRTEHKTHRDIIVGNFADTYLMLTTKTMAGLRWVTAHCGQAKFILKTDDDCFHILTAHIDYLSQINNYIFYMLF